MPESNTKRLQQCLIFFCLSVFFSGAQAAKLASIIIDDLGNNYEHGKTIINFPASITLSILPQTQYATQLATLAHHHNKEVMLHLPLQSIGHHKATPGTLKLHMTRLQFSQQFKINLDSVPHVQGINNHMGSLLTQHPGHMDWLMTELSKLHDVYFVDSRTSKKSVAAKIADSYDIPNLSRDVFLDPDTKPGTLRKQFDHFIAITKKQGYAIAIAHPYPSTLAFLKKNIEKLAENGIELVPVSKLLELRGNQNYVTCTGPTCSGL